MDLYLIFLVLFLVHLPESVAVHNQKYDVCSYHQPCGDYSETNYPFYDSYARPDYCGYPGFKFECNNGSQQLTILNHTYEVNLPAVTNQSTAVMVSRMDKWTGGCPDNLANTTIDYSKFSFSPDTQNITFFYNCLDGDYSIVSLRTKCDLGGHGLRGGYYFTEKMLGEFVTLDMSTVCKASLFLPVMASEADVLDANATLENLIVALKNGFWLGLMADNDACSSCIQSGGLCGYDWDSNKFVCHCADADYYIKCGVNFPPDLVPSPNPRHLMKKDVSTTAVSAAITIVVLGSLVLLSYYIHQKYNRPPRDQRVKDCLRNYSSLVSRRYTYANIRKMTNSFREKLGEGGYGAVFKGILQDGRAVAVKVWKQSKGDGQEYINEVMSISRTSHVNIVSLLGFCFEGHKRALVYEFMPNGSLEKFIHGRDFDEKNQSLSSQKLLDIAIGIARGLEYLHRGCNTRIVHFDIKPHNILLDAEFTPKISDFGLAKSFNQKESIISMSGARGTAGYIAPEVFFRTFGGVSHKSDVYSFGMMVLEMVGCNKRVNHNVENSSELYFPQWIYKQLERGLALDSMRILDEEEKELERTMIFVGLWCIQTNPLSRPPISRVVEMLEGKVELQVPPMPSLSSIPVQQEQQPASEEYSSTLTLSSTTPEITHHFHSMQNC